MAHLRVTSLSCFSFFFFILFLFFLRKLFLFCIISFKYVSLLALVSEINCGCFLHEEKVSSFLFSCISFNYFFLLALVSEFNCFLRSPCSMEMWCPDDIGRDSWDCAGPPTWGRACFNSPEWGGSSSPVKTEPLQIVFFNDTLNVAVGRIYDADWATFEMQRHAHRATVK